MRGGGVESKDVVFDPTGSALSSTNVESAIKEVSLNSVRCITAALDMGTTTAGTGQSFSLSDASGGLVTTFAQLKGIGIIHVIGYNTYDTGAKLFVTTQGNINIIPTVSQKTVTARVFILY